MSNYTEFAGAKINGETKFIIQESDLSVRQIIELGVDKFLDDNPNLRLSLKKRWLDKQLKDLQLKKCSDADLEDSLEKEKLEVMFKISDKHDFFKKHNIADENEFIKSVYEIKKLAGQDNDLDCVSLSDLRMQAMFCNLDENIFKDLCCEALSLYEI